MSERGAAVVAHMGAAHFAQEVALALANLFQKTLFLTAVTPDGHDPVATALRILGKGKRRVNLPPGGGIRTFPWREVLRLTHMRIDQNEIRQDAVFHWALDGFDRWVASEVGGPHSNIGLVYGYETMCLHTFGAARERGVKTVLDLPSPEHDYVENLLWREYEKFPVLLTSARRRFRELQVERTARRHEEFRLADLVVANSSLTARTWAAAGLDENKIATVPLAGPEPDPRGAEGGTHGKGPLRLIWAGTFSVRKGGHLLAEAWRGWKGRGNTELDVYGSVSLPEAVKIQNLEGVRWYGPVAREKVLEAFRQADLLVFPTLCDGFGLVVAEALSQGLPVLTTRQAGAADLIRDGENGFLVEAGSVDALGSSLKSIYEQREKLQEMRSGCLQSAKKNSLRNYQKVLAQKIKSIL